MGPSRKKTQARHPLLFLLVVLFVGTRRTVALLTPSVTTPAAQQIVVHFDGSLRKPADPGFATESLGWMAACAASVSSDTDGGEPILLLGGRDLTDQASPALSSGAVEYEGLLLALQGLSSILRGSSFDSSSIQSVVVRGDCKTVIQQLQGRAISRKMDGYYQKAERLLQDDPVLCDIQEHLTYEHIPRSENTLCDRLCAAILYDRQAAALDDLSQQVQQRSGVVDTTSSTTANDEAIHKMRKKGVAEKKYFTLETEKAWKLIPMSKRPELYRALVLAPTPNSTHGNLEYSRLLLEVAQRLRLEVETVWRKANLTELDPPPDYLATLEARALAYEWQAIQQQTIKATRKAKELTRLEQKHRYLWKKHATLVHSVLAELSRTGNSTAILMAAHTKNQSIDWPAPVTSWRKESRKSSSWNQNKLFWQECRSRRIDRRRS